LPHGTGWKGSALANDFEQATIEVLHQHESNATDSASIYTRHYFHRQEMHLLVAEVLVNNSAGKTALDLDFSTPWPAKDSGAAGITFKPAPSVATGKDMQCQVGETTESERVATGQNAGTGMERVTVAVCYPTAKTRLRAGPATVVNASTVVTVYTSRESQEPLKDAIAAWQHYTALGMESLHALHSSAQIRLWSSRIEVEGDLELAKAVNSSLYGILISVREDLNYSTSPGGLPNGCYNGHTFWLA
jgi:trehalose/maltose hydrolase-like predicted phosphorylase